MKTDLTEKTNSFHNLGVIEKAQRLLADKAGELADPDKRILSVTIRIFRPVESRRLKMAPVTVELQD